MGTVRPSRPRPAYLPLLEVHLVQAAVVVLDLDGPGLAVVGVLVDQVHNRRDHVRVHLIITVALGGSVNESRKGKGHGRAQ